MIDPKDMIKRLSVEELCVTAENYFKCITDTTHLKIEPFSSLREAPELLENLSLLLSGLHLGKTMTVLDFGAGTCWISRFLNQLQCRTISCDASATALEIGKQLFADCPIIGEYVAEPVFLPFDGHRIDLPDHSVDRIISHDAFHHVPNQEEILSEFSRVLKDGGIAGFSEPGRFHSQSPQAQFEMKNHNILENNIDLDEIFAIARSMGFTHLSCRFLNNMEMTLDDYDVLTDSSPKRLGKILKKKALKKKVFENIRTVTPYKSIFFLYKGVMTLDSRSHVGLSHTIAADTDIVSVKENQDLNLKLCITNTGIAQWLKDNIKGIGVVTLGTHLYDDKNKLLNFDFSKHYLDRALSPGDSIDKLITLRFPAKGTFLLALDLLSEGVSWFEHLGSQPLYITVTVN